MTTNVNQQVSEAIRQQISAALSAKIDPGFTVIRYPSGFAYVLQYGASAYYNPATLELIDQLVVANGDGTADIAGSRFSSRYCDILNASTFNVSTADAKAQDAANREFSKASDELVKQFEKDLGRIRKQQLQGKDGRTIDKILFVEQYIEEHYVGAGQSWPISLTGLETKFSGWSLKAQNMRRSMKLQQDAMNLLSQASQNVKAPDQQNGGMQTGPTDWVPAYKGLPDVTDLATSITSGTPQMNVKLEFDNTGNNTMKMKVDNQSIGPITPSMLQFSISAQDGSQQRSAGDLWTAASRVIMDIDYCGVTLVSSHPQDIADDLSTGWYSQNVISQLAQKTGQDVTGFQLQSSLFDAGTLFGKGKTFARVKTFVISDDPTITLWFYGINKSDVDQKFSVQSKAELTVGGIAAFGTKTTQYQVNSVQDAGAAVKVVIMPDTSQSAALPENQRAHVIGGVLDFPS